MGEKKAEWVRRRPQLLGQAISQTQRVCRRRLEEDERTSPQSLDESVWHGRKSDGRSSKTFLYPTTKHCVRRRLTTSSPSLALQ